MAARINGKSRQAAAVFKRFVTDFGQAFRERYGAQPGAALKCPAVDGLKAFGEVQSAQPGADVEGLVSNGGYAPWNRDRFQL